ncbi:MAG: type II toxin-antitoxin system RatA family toxin [Solirubrobacteraceae bacterium]
MSDFGGESSVEIAAPAAVCFELVCDTPRTPDWHQAIAAVEVLERDGHGRTSLVRASIDALVTRVQVELPLSYEEHRALYMRRESGDLTDLTVTWTFEDLGDGRSQASFQIQFDPGRVLSMLARGPVVARLETLLAKQPPEGLKRAVETASRPG